MRRVEMKKKTSKKKKKRDKIKDIRRGDTFQIFDFSLSVGRSLQQCGAVNVIISRQRADIWKTSPSLLPHDTQLQQQITPIYRRASPGVHTLGLCSWLRHARRFHETLCTVGQPRSAAQPSGWRFTLEM